MPPQEIDKRQAAREVIDILHEIATLLNTNLNRTQLSFCVSLIENGVNPEALAVRLALSQVHYFRTEGACADRKFPVRSQNVIRNLREQYPEPLEPELGDEEGGEA
ncbi:Mitotic-spindle organizing protein 1 [Diplodia seriata]|uniref:Mitotic-spindle organizing protein 1 n=1 Tax=Diplodia seriata TaxID=420778 RepID=A0A1S8BFN9_9PEZI|nr:Mitotic-spindle organizing protein 1 [Diplodia seriata]